jgi:transcription-repair coupling factor (superfamily II helicase)
MNSLEIFQLQQLVEKHPNIAAAAELLKKLKVVSVRGLHGSSRALFAIGAFHKNPRTALFVFNDQETAAYFYHDITQVIGSEDVLFFPSAYKRASKYGQIDSANEFFGRKR